MNNPLKNVVIIAVVLVGLYFLTNYNQNANLTKKDVLFSGKKSDIVKILIQSGENAIQIEKQDTTWNIAGSDTLVIRQNRVDDLFDKVLEVKRTTIRSKKESNWINYSVDDSTGTHLVLLDISDNTIGYYVFGRSKSDWAHNFVRLRNENENKDVLKNVYETSESVIHYLNTSETYWGEKPKEPELNSTEIDSLGV
jgi:hypothetical protein